ncbi:MAG: hypothetical protein Q9170_000367 [Blastenia crenularia]
MSVDPSSPTSIASSSDLYAASEPAEEYASIQPKENEAQASEITAPARGVMSSNPEIPPELKAMSEEDYRHISQGSRTEVHDKSFGIAKHKRKRDEEAEQLYPVATGSSGPGPRLQEYCLPDSGRQTPKADARPFSETSVGIKRLKVKGHMNEDSGPASASNRVHTLPAELWHHIFRFVPPVFLGRLLRVNRTFHSYLTSYSNGSKLATDLSQRGVRPLDAETIWAASRKRFAAGLPKPLRDLQELEMWRLLRGRTCQLCGIVKGPGPPSGIEDPWEAGPGEQYVREVDLLLSSDFSSFLLPALPFAFVSSSMNYIPSTLLRESAAPTSTRIVKRFYKPHVQQIKRKLDEVRELGVGSADEWTKGLAEEGKERINNAVRWEQWEAKGGLKKVNVRPQAKAVMTSTDAHATRALPRPQYHADLNGSASQQGPLIPRYDGPPLNGPVLPPEAQYYQQKLQPPYHVPWINTRPFQDPSLPQPPAPVPTARPERTIREVNEAKAARRAEIERRCSLLHPPLLPHILSHMDPFQAAIHISTSFTDTDWDVLKPRLLSQRATAEKREQEQVQQNELLQSEFKQRRYQETQSKDSKESIDRHWDSVQAPVRDRLGVLADIAVDEQWSGGRAVTKDNSPKFAADVLLYVRQHFYDEVSRAKEAAAIIGRPAKDDLPNSPPTQTLTLENMKWVFDTKIKPFTENFQRELFLCNGCDDNFKFYGFEGVIQHYAAKHTTSLSMGSVVVYWRAEWPEQPPFNPEPSLSKSAYYKVPSPATGSSNGWNSAGQQPFYPGSSYGAALDTDPKSTLNGNSAHTNTTYQGTQVAQFTHASYPPSYQQGYSSSPAYTTTLNGVPNGSLHYPPTGQLPHWQGNNAMAAPIHGTGGHEMGPQYNGYGYPNGYNPQGPVYGTSYGTQPVLRAPAPRPPHFDPSRNNAAQLTEGYQQQMDDLAKQARDVWHNTSNIRDLPASVRIYVVIHHVAARFSEKFSAVPSLAMFLDGLDNNSQMRPVRSLNGLACKTCVTQQNTPFAPNLQSQQPASDRRLYTLPHLLNHFRTVHLEGPQAFANPNSGPDAPKFDWTRDMIELPESSLIAGLVHSMGMDDTKFELIAWAFPQVFPSPLPRLEALRNPRPISTYGGVPSVSYPTDDYSNNRMNHAALTASASTRDRRDDSPYKQVQSAFRSVSRMSRPSEPPGEDEYDPHKPAYQGKLGLAGASVEAPELHTLYPADRAQEKYEWAEPSGDRQVPETMDLSKLIYGATQMQPVRELPEHRGDQRQHPSARLASPTFSRPDNNGGESTRGTSIHKKSVDDDRHRNGQPVDHCIPEEAGAKSSRNDEHSPSTSANIRAAEQFLQHLGQASDIVADHRPPSYEQHNKRSFVSHRSDGNYVEHGEARQYSTKPVDHVGHRVAQATYGMSPNSSAHASRPVSNGIRNNGPLHIQSSETYSQANYHRIASNALIHDADLGTNGRGSRGYSEYLAPSRTVLEDDHSQNGYSIERPDSRRGARRIAHPPYNKDRPRSPASVAVDPAYYRSESPTAEAQSQPVYRIRSPVTQKDPHAQRTFYEYPRQDRYEIVGEHDYAPSSQDRYAPRIEYVPVRMGNQAPPDSGRYIVAQALDPRDRADYVRLEETYDQGAVYERDGQLYRAEPRIYQPPLRRGSAGYGSSYPY